MKKLKTDRNSFLLFLFFFLSFSMYGQELSISRGHQLLQEKEYLQAKELYTGLINEGFRSIPLYYNLGIAHFELGEMPESILYFEKALKLQPGNKNIQHNLDLANKKIDQDFIQVQDFFISRYWQKLYLGLSPNGWLFIVIALIILLILALFLYVFGASTVLRKWGMRVFYPLLLLLFLGLLASNERSAYHKDQTKAIVLEPIEMFSGPDDRSEKMYEIKPGTKISIQDQLEGWLKIELINKETGWIAGHGFARI